MPLYSSLELVEQVAELHTNYQAGHAEENVTPDLNYRQCKNTLI